MEKVVILILVFGFSFSCSELKNQKKKSVYLQQLLQGTNRQLTSGELSMATSICDAVRFKRQTIVSSLFNYYLRFKMEEQTCQNANKTSSTIDTILVGNGPSFSSTYSGNYFEKMQTDQFGELKKICEAIFFNRDNNTNNPITINEVISSEEIIEYKFEQDQDDNTLIHFFASYGKKDGTSYRSYKIMEYIILITDSESPSKRGLLKGTMNSQVCSSGDVNTSEYLSAEFTKLVKK
ncbi:MAG: hypothetical protein ISR65_04575 [Bacteriovoracaceae bacterium]|nr:hypothetical protein [Bacteriovoracaceae bacterium]